MNRSVREARTVLLKNTFLEISKIRRVYGGGET